MRCRLTVLLAMIGAMAWVTPRASAQPDASSDSLSAADSATVVTFDGRPLFSIRASFKNVTPAQRAALISERLEHLAHRPEFEPESLRVADTEISSDVLSEDFMVLAVLDEDTVGTGLARHDLAEQRASAVRAALIQSHQARTVRRIGWCAIQSVLATLGLVAALILLGRLRKRMSALLGRWIDARREQIAARTQSIIAPERLLVVLAVVLRAAIAALELVLVYVYAGFVLSAWPWTQAAGAHLGALVMRPLTQLATGFVSHLPGFVFIAVVVILAHFVLKAVTFVFSEIESGHVRFGGFYPEWAQPTARIVRVVIVALAIVIAYPFVPGSSSLAFKGVSVFLGVLVSLGSTSVVGNLVAGIMVVYMRSYRVGDVIKIGEQFGRVVETDALATRLRTPKNVEITIPNATMITSNVINYSRQAADQGLILHTQVTIGYNVPWRQVHALLLRAAARTNGVLAEPAPFVLQRALGDFAVTYEINAHTREPERMARIYGELHRNILDEFNEYGVEIMTPAYEGDRPEPTLVRKEQWYAAPAIPQGQPGADE